MPLTPPSSASKRKLRSRLTSFDSSTPASARPNGGYDFVQKTGPRAGQHYNVVTGKSGLAVRKYASGDTAIAQTDQGVDINQQRQDVAAQAGPNATRRRLAAQLRPRKKMV